MHKGKDKTTKYKVVLVAAVVVIALALATMAYMFVNAEPRSATEQVDTAITEEPEAIATSELFIAEDPIPESMPIVAVEQPKEPTKQDSAKSTKPSGGSTNYSGGNFKRDGVWYHNGYRYTYYSSRVLRHYRTGEWNVDDSGVYRDSEGYAVVASDDHAQGSVIADTPFGPAKVYDSGCGSGTIDVYVNY